MRTFTVVESSACAEFVNVLLIAAARRAAEVKLGSRKSNSIVSS